MCSGNVIGNFGAVSLLRSFELALPSVCGGSSDHTTRHSNGIALPGWTRLAIAASPSLWQQEQRDLEASVGRKLANKKMDKRPVRLRLLQWVPFQDLGRGLLEQMACAYAYMMVSTTARLPHSVQSGIRKMKPRIATLASCVGSRPCIHILLVADDFVESTTTPMCPMCVIRLCEWLQY